MIELRVSKYDPSLRDEKGCFTENEWTCVTDIGKSFGEKILTLENYLAVEDEYISVIQQIMRIAGINEVTICDLEVYKCNHLPLFLQEDCSCIIANIHDKQSICFDVVLSIARSVLRNAIWCRLQGEKGFYVHFGWDFYLYIGYSGEFDCKNLITTPLFVEPYQSPYRK